MSPAADQSAPGQPVAAGFCTIAVMLDTCPDAYYGLWSAESLRTNLQALNAVGVALSCGTQLRLFQRCPFILAASTASTGVTITLPGAPSACSGDGAGGLTGCQMCMAIDRVPMILGALMHT